MEAICNHSDQDLVMNITCLVYSFQTLISGLLAAAIATWVGFLILNQLRDSNLQARISRRETMALLLSEGVLRFKKVEDTIREPLDYARRITSGPQDEPLELSPEAAHVLDQKFHGILDWYLVNLSNTEHSTIEALKSALKNELDLLSGVLQKAHWAAHNDQHDEDHSFSDEAWKEVLKRHEQAKNEAYQFVIDTERAYLALRDAQKEWVRSLREKISKLDLEISTKT